MARPKNQVPTLTHHKASGQAKVRIGGKDHYLGRWGSQDAREAYARLIGEAAVAGPAQAARRAANDTRVTVSDVCLLWVDHAELVYTKNGKPTSHVGTFVVPIRCLRELYGETAAAKFGPLALEVVRARFVTMGLSRKVANRYAGNIRKIFKWAASRELIPATVVAALGTLEPLKAGRTAAREVEAIEPIDDDTVNATLPHLTPLVADMVRLARLSGMRPGEVCSLRPGDIDRTGDVWKYVPAEHKMMHENRQRVVFLGPQCQKLLAKYLLRGADEFCFSPSLSVQQKRERRAASRKSNRQQKRPGKRKAVREPGKRYTANTFRVAIVRGCELAFGMPKELRLIPAKLDATVRAERIKAATEWRRLHTWHPNQLRHSFATQARQVAGIESVQALLGHAELSTAQIYAEKSTELATRVVRQIG